ncbi:hypothetical protein C8J57DRAFT_143607 [Mycena rebaudengoi]|nr:hypothetical protein C8J57DRAFT_143607 [Mycena rebaudengoi]
MTSAASKKIVVVGSGFAGMWAAIAAARKLDLADKVDGSVEIILIAPEPTLVIRPRLYEPDVSTASAPLGELLSAVGVRFVQGTVQHIAVDKNALEYVSTDGTTTTIAFDRLVLASGSKLFRPEGVTGLADYTFDTDQMENALKFDAHLRSLTALPDSPARNTVVVCGGGFTGIEVASEMPLRLRNILGEKTDVKVIVLERNDAIGPELGPNPRPIIQEALTSLGVEIWPNQAVVSVDADGVTTASGLRIASKTVIWTAGMRASDLTAQIPAERDPIGRLHVTPNLKVVGLDNVFATGDTAHVSTGDAAGHLALMSCQHAIGLGRAAGTNVIADLLGLPQDAYNQVPYGTCLALGPWGALFTQGWDRQTLLVKEEGHKMKTQINTQWIYPPPPIKAQALAAANPSLPVVG